MIVFDASTRVGATFRRTNIPSRAVRHAFQDDRLAVSEPVLGELVGMLARPKLARVLDPALRSELLWQLDNLGMSFEPAERVTDCRDAKDNEYLKLALASGTGVIVGSDADMLVLHPWRGVCILRPAEYLRGGGRGP